MNEEDAGSRRPDPLHDFFNLLATKENVEEIPSQKPSQKKATVFYYNFSLNNLFQDLSIIWKFCSIW